MSNMKYILVTGGVISGVGKGVIASSFGTILKSCGIEVTSIKIDPYINLDAGTFSPYEHGEVFVLDDGGEVDLDLGNYERFLNITLHRDNNITTGKIYKMVIDKERRGDYLGKTVQVVPHITDAIQEWVERVAQIPVSEKRKIPQVCIVELGGTIGDIESMAFVEAFRQFQFRAKRENFCVAHVSLVPQPRSTGEPKTKPTQSSVRELRGLGLSPDFIVCRSEKPIVQSVKEKISNFCHVAPEQVICIPDLSSIYKVPILMESHGIVEYLNERLQLGIKSMPRRHMRQWIDLSDRIDNLRNDVCIALVGKYTRLEDSYTSVTKALQHAANTLGYKVNVNFIEASNLEKEMLLEDPVAYHEAWKDLCKSEGVIVPGGFGKRGMEGKIEASRWCRENGKPYLGICLGFQAAVIEFARNVLNLKGAHTTECEPDVTHPVIIDMPEHNTGEMGGTMRLGKRVTLFKQSSGESKIRRLYQNKDKIEERHRHRYEVNPKYISDIEKAGLEFVGVDTDAERMEILELENHPYYVAVQFHPEYLSRPMAPSPPFMGLVLASKEILKSYLARGCKLSPRESDYYDSDVSATEMPYDSCCIVSNIRCGKYDSNMEYTQYKNSFHIKCDMDLCNLEYLKKSNTLRNWNCKSCSKEVKNSELSQDKQLPNVSASIGINTNTGEMVDDYSEKSTNITLVDVMNELKLIHVAQMKAEQSLDAFNKKVNECCSLLKQQNERITQYIEKIEGTSQY